MKVVVIGATGSTGHFLMKELIANPSVTEVVALVRKSVDFGSAKVTCYMVDFSDTESWKELVAGDAAFSCLGTTLKDAGSKDKQWIIDYDYQFLFAKAAKENGVKYFGLVSSVGASTKSMIFYSRMKGQLEDDVVKLNLSHLLILRPGMLNRPNTERTSEKLTLKVITFLNRLGILNSQKPLLTSDLAKVLMTETLANKDSVKIIEGQKILKHL